METGALVLGGIFAGAIALMVLNARHRGAVERRLLAQGFERCDEQLPVLRQALLDVAGGLGPAPRRDYRIGRCFRKAAGWGMVYRFAVSDETHADQPDGRGVGASFDAYLLDLPDAERLSAAPACVYFAPGNSRAFRMLIEKLVKLSPMGAPLEIRTDTPWTRSFVAAFGENPGKLDDSVPPGTQERLSQAAGAGFFAAHFGRGRLALFALPGRKDVETHWNFVAGWL